MQLSTLLFVLAIAVCVQGACKLTGVNQAVAEFHNKPDGSDVPGILGTNYRYPKESADYFVNKGMNVFRIPFLWERLVRTKGANFSSIDIDGLVQSVNYMSAKAYVIIDPHNYGRGFGEIIGQGSTTIQDFADFWVMLANVFKNNPKVIFGLMNEPHDQDINVWRNSAQAAVNAIRSTGAKQLILVPGIAYTGAGSWVSSGNARVMWDIIDSEDNHAIEVHQYLDKYSSGNDDACEDVDGFGSSKLKEFTEWARVYKKMGFLGEFGAASNARCLKNLDEMLDYMDANTDVWLGWTYWSAGPWWGEYSYSLQPNITFPDRPQWASVSPHINSVVPTSLKVKGNTPPGPVNIAIYTDTFMNNFGSWSWAPQEVQDATQKHSGDYSISFTASSGKSLMYVCLRNCINSTVYTYLQFWVYLNSGSADSLSLCMVDIATNNENIPISPKPKVSSMISKSFALKTWIQVTVPLANWTTQDAYDGIRIDGTADGYIDDINLVRYLYGSTPGTSATSSVATSTTKSATSSGATSSTKGASTSGSATSSGATSAGATSAGATSSGATSSKSSTSNISPTSTTAGNEENAASALHATLFFVMAVLVQFL